MKRRSLLRGAMALGAGVALAALAQAPVRRVGWLVGGSPTTHAKLLAAFREGLREHGWVEGRNLKLELRWAEGRPERLPALATELAASKPDVVVTAANTVHLAMRAASSEIPIVMATGADPVRSGLAASLARPGGNVTGVTGFFENTSIKMLELGFALAAPGATVAILVDSGTLSVGLRVREDLEQRARGAGYRLEFFQVATLPALWQALERMAKDRPAMLIVLPGSMMFAAAQALPGRAGPLGIPVIYPFEECVEHGGLMSYAADLAYSYRRAARYVDRILRGANPAELPIEQPTRLTLTINLNAAKQIGLALPSTFLARADRIIE